MALCALLSSCADPAFILGSTTTEATTIDSLGVTGPPVSPSSSDGLDSSDGSGTPPPCGDPDSPGCGNAVDLLFVIDNSGTMGEEQLNLATNFGLLVERLQTLEDGAGNRVGVDVNIMVTTTDFDNRSCHGPWTNPSYTPAKGSPIYTPCTERLERFTGFGDDPLVVEDACLLVCDPDAPAAPEDHFIHFDTLGDDNVVGGGPAEALACLGPQGIDGCGYEAPLESMLQALNPDACWNDPEACSDPRWDWLSQPFLRPGSLLAVAIITDEADCSVRDFTIMGDVDFMEVDPSAGTPQPSSALCWNAGVVCSGLDPRTGEYTGCTAADIDIDGTVGVDSTEAVLHPLSRYTDLLGALEARGHEILMLGVLGVPEVTEHAPGVPHQPTAGGLEALVYRNWRDPDVPAGGDILPGEWSDGVRAANKQFEFGIGPGCTGYDADAGTYTGQAIPPVRIREVCESLDTPDDPATTQIDETRIRCCVESICDDDFSPAIECLTGLIEQAVVPVK
ncbi:MAG: VWA domain-containing protein [Deltaproteobacteria bacterium]|nr:VWA domain-containing protein [Deltaproteobacteria bacterium]